MHRTATSYVACSYAVAMSCTYLNAEMAKALATATRRSLSSRTAPAALSHPMTTGCTRDMDTFAEIVQVCRLLCPEAWSATCISCARAARGTPRTAAETPPWSSGTPNPHSLDSLIMALGTAVDTMQRTRTRPARRRTYSPVRWCSAEGTTCMHPCAAREIQMICAQGTHSFVWWTTPTQRWRTMTMAARRTRALPAGCAPACPTTCQMMGASVKHISSSKAAMAIRSAATELWMSLSTTVNRTFPPDSRYQTTVGLTTIGTTARTTKSKTLTRRALPSVKCFVGCSCATAITFMCLNAETRGDRLKAATATLF